MSLLHSRLESSLSRLPREHAKKRKSALAKLFMCSHKFNGVAPLTSEPMARRTGKPVQSSWHCRNPFCPRASASRTEKALSKYRSRAVVRLQQTYSAATLTFPSNSEHSLKESYFLAKHAKRHLFQTQEFKDHFFGGYASLELNYKEICSLDPSDVSLDKIWSFHIHLLLDCVEGIANQERLLRLWNSSLKAAGGTGQQHQYFEPVEHFEAYFRYINKPLDPSRWPDSALDEFNAFHLSPNQRIRWQESFGNWNNLTRSGRVYAGAKAISLEQAKNKVVEISSEPILPEVQLVGVTCEVAGVNEGKVSLKSIKLRKGKPVGIRKAVAVELLCGALGDFFYSLRRLIRLTGEVHGIRTGQIMSYGELAFELLPSVTTPGWGGTRPTVWRTGFGTRGRIQPHV